MKTQERVMVISRKQHFPECKKFITGIKFKQHDQLEKKEIESQLREGTTLNLIRKAQATMSSQEVKQT